MLRSAFCFLLLVFIAYPSFAYPQQQNAAAPTSPELEMVKQGQKLNSEGKQDDALALYQKALALSPNLYDAHLASGVALDLKGQYAEARKHFSAALELAPHDARTQVQQATAISYAFEGKIAQAIPLEEQVFSVRLGNSDFNGAASTANELARICLEAGDIANADKWYKVGYDTAVKIPSISDADQNLWLFRWENAQARIAARSGHSDEAKQHIAAAKAALDKANNPDQARFFPYLTGYVAFYAGDNKTAIAELEKADQRDPMVLVLLGEAYEKSGDRNQAQEYFKKVLTVNAHNPANAYARPLAKKKLGA